MSSQINPSLIDSTYPIAGVNQSSQGFRSNFLATQQNFAETVIEINDLLNKVVVTAPLTYGNSNVSVNNFGGMGIANVSINNSGLTIYNHGVLTTGTTENFDFNLGTYHTISLGGSSTLTTIVNPINFPNLGYSELNLQITITNTAHNLSFNGLTLTPKNTIPGFNSSSNIINFESAGPHFLTLGTPDGINWTLTRKNSSAVAKSSTPTSSIGVLGDTSGMVTYDANYIYICSSNYDGTTSIWKRSALSSF
jgi:hypothetical protein